MAAPDGNLVIMAPISGVIVPITEVPDPTFAQKMVGDGVAIDPVEETLRSPCDASVVLLPASHHALTLEAAGGIQILIHVGLETVGLKGQGFEAVVGEGDRVKAGDPLILFDADYVARHALSLLTMVVVTTPDVVVTPLAEGSAASGETAILEISPPSAAEAAGGAGGGLVTSQPVVIMNPNGLHARPSAVLGTNAKRFKSAIKLVAEDGRSANAKSVTAVMALAVKRHDAITVTAEGPDAAEAVETLVPLIQAGLGESLHAIPAPKPAIARPAPPPAPERPKDGGDPNVLVGVAASPGLVAGVVYQLRGLKVELDERGSGQEFEKKRLLDAIAAAGAELAAIESSLRLSADTGKAAIFAAHKELLEDPELLEAALEGIGRGQSAGWAWRESYTRQAETLAGLSNELLAARAADVRDVGERVLAKATGFERREAAIPERAIFVAPDLTPTDTANLQKSGALGFCVTGGSATSHASILARAAGIPAVVAAPERALELADGTPVILDGDRGALKVNPSEAEMAEVRDRRAAMDKARADELAAATLPAETVDGFRVKVVGNISGAAEASEIPELGGEGVGLLRSEFLFLERAEAPSEVEQTAVYSTIARSLGKERDLIVRTLDVGGDKPLAYMPLPEEVNPFLGIRGIRLNLLGTSMFTAQVRSILKSASLANLGIMFPMVTTVSELRAAKETVLRERESLGVTDPVQIGIMVEVPSAAIMADLLAPEVDFFSIGTNDLTQYTLAVDRGHPRLARMADALHPAVLRLISATTEAAHRHGKWVGVCGGVASEPQAAAILLGLGVDELSVSVKGIPTIKAAVRRLSMAGCRALAQEAKALKTAAEVRELLAGWADRPDKPDKPDRPDRPDGPDGPDQPVRPDQAGGPGPSVKPSKEVLA